MPLSHDRAIGPIGTASRAVLGTAMIILAVAVDGMGWSDVVAVLTALPASAITAAALARAAGPAVATAAVITAVTGLGTLLTFVSPVDRPAIVAYVGLSMLLAAIRGDAGCELLSLPNRIFRRRTSSACPLFTPIDAAESRPT